MNRDIIERTELIITITPTIIDDPMDVTRLSTDFMRAATAVERVFETWPLVVPDVLLETWREKEPVAPVVPDELPPTQG